MNPVEAIKLFAGYAKDASSEQLCEMAAQCAGLAVVFCHVLQERGEVPPFDPDVLIAVLESSVERKQ